MRRYVIPRPRLCVRNLPAIWPFFYIGAYVDGVREKPKIILLAIWGLNLSSVNILTGAQLFIAA